ncbi:MAG: MotA/TolQ/ExbB proton channel family protein [bacterium]|jgi:chemotaxis protein MotA|nr:motility protein A [Planctomycetota bacterium]HIL52438.1 motility protein A [Planctomycetota bacterium]
MDLATILGTIMAFGLVIFAMATGPGGVAIFINVPSLVIVFGGTFAVTMVNFPLSEVKSIARVMMITAFNKTGTPSEEIERIVEYANLARKEGLLALESKLQEVDDSFFAKGIQLVIDGFGADTVRDIMELEADWQRQRHGVGKKIMDQMGAFAPAFGMIGTLVGLVQMLQNLSDPSMIGVGMATALLTTLYGAMLSNMVFLPLSGKLEILAGNESLLRDLMIEGIVAIQSGEKPALIKEKLKGFLAPTLREAVEL